MMIAGSSDETFMVCRKTSARNPVRCSHARTTAISRRPILQKFQKDQKRSSMYGAHRARIDSVGQTSMSRITMSSILLGANSMDDMIICDYNGLIHVINEYDK